MILKIITFLRKKHNLLMILLGSGAIMLYFLTLYVVSLFSDNNIMLSVAYKNKAFSERIALLAAGYVEPNSDAMKRQCVIDVMQTDLSLLKSSNRALACSKKAGKITTDTQDKIKFLSGLESIDKVNNYIIHGNNLLKEDTATSANKDFAYILNNINDELLIDLKKIIELQEQEVASSAIIVKNTEKLLSLIIWLIIVTKILGHNNITDSFVPKKQVRKILIVEDNRVTAEIISKIIENSNYVPVLACNGQEALDVIEKDREFVLILMDCEMPVMDGFEATANIRKNEKEQNLPRIPIIALTANVLEGYKQTCLENGMDDYLSKPVTVGGVTSIVQKWERHRNFNRSKVDEL